MTFQPRTRCSRAAVGGDLRRAGQARHGRAPPVDRRSGQGRGAIDPPVCRARRCRSSKVVAASRLGNPVRRRRQHGTRRSPPSPPPTCATSGSARSRCRATSARKRRCRAGLDHARGRAVVPMDVDLQDPPEVLGEMVAKWREGYEMVFGVRRCRATRQRAKRWTAGLYYRAHNALSRQDSGERRRLPPARPQGGRRHQGDAGAQPLHEGPVRLGRLQARRRSI